MVESKNTQTIESHPGEAAIATAVSPTSETYNSTEASAGQSIATEINAYPAKISHSSQSLQQTKQQQQQQNDMSSLFTGVSNPNTISAAGFDPFQNYGIHVPFISSSASNPLYMATSDRRGFSLPRPTMTSSDMGSNISLMEWYKGSDPSGIPCVPSNYNTFPMIQRHRTLPQRTRINSDPFFVEAVQYQDLFSMDKTNKYTVQLFPQVDRGFFLSDNDWTCYRRNYFQVSSTFSLFGNNAPATGPECPCIIVENDNTHIVKQFLIGISAQVANSDKKIELVQHTPKRDKGPQTTPQPQPVRASGGAIHSSSVGVNTNTVCFERLQFKTATANNGKRRAAQQYYVLVAELYAESDDGSRVLVAASASAPIVVRGRSPGHYADGSNRRSTGGHASKIGSSFSSASFDSYSFGGNATHTLSLTSSMRSATSMMPSVNPSFSGDVTAGYPLSSDVASTFANQAYSQQIPVHPAVSGPPHTSNGFGANPFSFQEFIPQQQHQNQNQTQNQQYPKQEQHILDSQGAMTSAASNPDTTTQPGDSSDPIIVPSSTALSTSTSSSTTTSDAAAVVAAAAAAAVAAATATNSSGPGIISPKPYSMNAKNPNDVLVEGQFTYQLHSEPSSIYSSQPPVSSGCIDVFSQNGISQHPSYSVHPQQPTPFYATNFSSQITGVKQPWETPTDIFANAISSPGPMNGSYMTPSDTVGSNATVTPRIGSHPINNAATGLSATVEHFPGSA